MSDFYLKLDELILEYDVDTLSAINIEFDRIKSTFNYESILEKIDIDQFEQIVKGLEESYKSKQLGSEQALNYYLSAIKLTIPDFGLAKCSISNYNFIELKCLLLIALETNALSKFELSNKISIFLIEQIESYNRFSNLDNTDRIKIKVIQNIAYNYHCLDKDQQALEYAQKGITLCIHNKSMYLLFALYYRKATALYYLSDDKTAAIKNFKLSISVLDLLGKDKVKEEFIRITEEKYKLRL